MTSSLSSASKPSRHERHYRDAAIDFAPPGFQAAAATAATIALTFFGHRFESRPLVIAVVACAALLLVGATIWGWAARKASTDRTQAPQGFTPRNRSDWRGWGWIACLLAALMTAGVAIIIYEGLRPAPSFASNYDGLDPNTYQCAGSATVIPGDTHPSLRTRDGQQIGHLELRRSLVCSTVWVKVIFDAGRGAALKGGTARITMVRPGDDARAPYALPLSGGQEGFGNMLSASQSCVRAEVALVQPGTSQPGPITRTACA
jgi:hypothetical protein